MKKSNSDPHEGSGEQRIEAIYKITYDSPGVGAAKCQVCGYSFEPGDAVVAYVYRPAEESEFQIENILCDNKTHAHPTEFTLGVRELLVEGRLQQASATESPSHVIAEPELLAVSEPSTKSAQKTLSDTDPGQRVTDPDAQPRASLDEARPRTNQPAHPGLGGDQR